MAGKLLHNLYEKTKSDLHTFVFLTVVGGFARGPPSHCSPLVGKPHTNFIPLLHPHTTTPPSVKSTQHPCDPNLDLPPYPLPMSTHQSRLLEGLRSMKKNYLNLNSDMKKDLKWFMEFAAQWNGVGIIPRNEVATEIYVDASGTGIGAHNGALAYATQVVDLKDPVKNIAYLEAVNIVVALHTFVNQRYQGKVVRIHCDNEATVSVLATGRGKDRTMLDVARAAWMVEAMFNIKLLYVHVPGKLNILADHLSRAAMSTTASREAGALLCENNIMLIQPCLHAIDNVHPSIYSSTGLRLTAAACRAAPIVSQSGRDREGQAGNGEAVPQLHPLHEGRPTAPGLPGHMCMDRGKGDGRRPTSDSKEQTVTLEGVRVAGGCEHGTIPAPPCDPSGRRATKGQVLYTQTIKGDTSQTSTICAGRHPKEYNGTGCKSSDPGYVPRSPPPIGGRAPVNQGNGLYQAPHTWRRHKTQVGHIDDSQVGQKYAELRPAEGSPSRKGCEDKVLCGGGDRTPHPAMPDRGPVSAPVCIRRVAASDTGVLCPQGLDISKPQSQAEPLGIYSSFTPAGSSYTSASTRLPRDRHPTLRGLAQQRAPGVHQI